MRTLPATVTTAIAKDATRPAYLLDIGVSAASPIGTTYATTWGADIVWNGQTYLASGIEVTNISRTAATLKMPLGESDPWLALSSDFRGRSLDIYQHYTDTTQSPQAGAVLIFSGILDEVTLGESMRVTVQEKSRAITFPPEAIGPPKFNYLLPSGSVIRWAGRDIVVR
jgi:hypothetical protein